jgi:hypothetical protein
MMQGFSQNRFYIVAEANGNEMLTPCKRPTANCKLPDNCQEKVINNGNFEI